MGVNNDLDLVLFFVEECQSHGDEYAEKRMWQRWQYKHSELADLEKAAILIQKKVDKHYRIFRWGYLALLGLGSFVLSTYVSIICISRYASNISIISCFVTSTIIVQIKLNFEYLQEIEKRWSFYCDKVSAFRDVIKKEHIKIQFANMNVLTVRKTMSK